jgi:predicted KAP-like P-loop ATPase
MILIDYYKQNLCVTAAYRPVRELLQQERVKDKVSPFLHVIDVFSFFLLKLVLADTFLGFLFPSISLKEKKQKAEEGTSSEDAAHTKEEGKSSEDAADTKEEGKQESVIILRPLNMDDMRQAKNQVSLHEFPFDLDLDCFFYSQSISK